MPGCAAALATVLPLAAYAQAWRLDGSAGLRAESTDNFGLTAQPRSASTLAATSELAASRDTEASRSRAALALEQRATSEGAATYDARLSGSQTFIGTVSRLEALASVGRNGQTANPRTPEEALIGPSTREALNLSSTWTQDWSERWTTRLRVAGEASTFSGRASAGDFRNATVAATLDHLFDTRTTTSLTLSASDYRLASGQSGTRTLNLNAGLSRSLDERSSLSLFFGTYRSERRVELGFETCPLPVSFCLSGFVPTVPVTAVDTRSDTGLQYDVSWRWQSDESTGLVLAASRQLAPGALGVQRSQDVRARLDARLAPRWTASLSWSEARSRATTGANTLAPVLRVFESAVSWQASQDFSVGLSASARRLGDAASGLQVQGHSVALQLQQQLPALWSDR